MPHVSRIRPPYRPIVEVDPCHSRLPIADGFNRDDALATIAHGEWYLVAFRSRHRPGGDDAFVAWLDGRPSRAASRLPGFIYDSVGSPLVDGSCLSYCLWRSQQDAVAAADDPTHREAKASGLRFFAEYRLERYRVVKQDGVISFRPLPPHPVPPAALLGDPPSPDRT